MFSVYRKVAAGAARRAVRAWPVALSLVLYAVILFQAAVLLAPMGMLGGILIALVAAACWSSYLELIAQAVAGAKIRVRWDELRRSFVARLWDVISVMFAFWIIALVTGPLTAGPNGAALSAILGIAMAFFFNAVPELLYQGGARSFALLMQSARFMLANPVIWLLPNLAFAAVALGAGGGLRGHRPAELLLAFGTTFSSPLGVVAAVAALPLWSLPLVLCGLHYVMIFRGLLFRELTSGGGNARLRAFQASMGR
jgi:hypothetical protein